ncbi:MAG: putative toxin-antitoxin system toxin component, PIN family [Schwartzia sp.]|nr:putative toxin-antitoxin system toxin component, PIN family [Schwartzia sp. (in: firmicutes)]
MLRVMLDTNILVSMAFYPAPTVSRFFGVLHADHKAVLCEYVIDEFRRIAQQKFHVHDSVIETFLHKFPYEFVATSQPDGSLALPKIRDENDAPILATAILEDVDILVTGDKDFLVLDLPKPKIMTMAEFIEAFAS